MNYQEKNLIIVLRYIARHKKLFCIDLICAFLVAGIDLVFPAVSRRASSDTQTPPEVRLSPTHRTFAGFTVDGTAQTRSSTVFRSSTRPSSSSMVMVIGQTPASPALGVYT